MPRFPEARPPEDQPHGLEPLMLAAAPERHEALGLVWLDLWHEAERIMGWDVAEPGLDLELLPDLRDKDRENRPGHYPRPFSGEEAG